MSEWCLISAASPKEFYIRVYISTKTAWEWAVWSCFLWGVSIFLYFVWFSFSRWRLFQGRLCQQVGVWLVTTHHWPLLSTQEWSLSPAWTPPRCPKPGHCLRCQNVNFIRVEFWSSRDLPQCVFLTLHRSTVSGTLPSHTKSYAHPKEGYQAFLKSS